MSTMLTKSTFALKNQPVLKLSILLSSPVGNIEKEIVREVARGDKLYMRKSTDRTNQSAALNAYERLPDLCFAICRFSHVRFITPSHLTHNFFFYFQ